MRASIRPALAALGCLAGLAAVPAAAPASRDQEAVLQDDPKIVFEDNTADLERTLARAHALGFDRIRLSVFWNLFGPAPEARRRPHFDAPPTDPDAYRSDAWQRYDRIVRLAAKHDLGVIFNVTGPAPRWAAAPRGAEPQPIGG